MNVKKDILWRAYISVLLVLLLCLAVVIQMLRLQTVKRTALIALADSLTTGYINIDPIRGNIYASDGSLLATSIPIYDARLDMRVDGLTSEVFKENIDSLSWCLSEYFKDKTPQEYKTELTRARRKGERYHLLHKGLSHSEIKDMRKFPLFRLGRFKGGLIAEQHSKRILPFGMLGQRTIGYTKDRVNPVGLEGGFNDYLKGNTGKRLMQKISGGVWVPINDENELDPKDGKDVITNIDVNIQDLTESALMKGVMANNAGHGSAIVMEVSTGKIKAIANLTRMSDGSYVEQYNYAIGESTEPGSTFKLASVMALLELGKATPDTKINTDGGTTHFYGREMKDSKAGHGTVNLTQAFEISSNVAISKAVYGAFAREQSKYTSFIYSLKLNKPLGLDIPGEGYPIVKNPKSKDWSGTTLPWMSIGYEIRLTPLQILTLYNAVANNGRMVKPQFVSEIRDLGKPVKLFDTVIINPKVCSDPTLNQLRRMMEGVVEHGTAANIKNAILPMAGKTGTAQIAANQAGYKIAKAYQASFVGYFPADKPLYSCIVVISSPSNGVYYGNAVAAPVFKEIAEKIYARTFTSPLKANPDSNEPLPIASITNEEYLHVLMGMYGGKVKSDLSDDINSWVKPMPKPGEVDVREIEVKKTVMPDVSGMVLSDALYLLENIGLKTAFSGAGKITAQSVPAGSPIYKGEVIKLQLN